MMPSTWKERITTAALTLIITLDTASFAQELLSKQKNLSFNRDIASKIKAFFKTRISQQFQTPPIDEEFNFVQASQFFIEKNFSRLDAKDRNIVLICFLCNEFENSQDSDIYSAIQQLYDSYSSTDSNASQTKHIMTCYHNLIISPHIYNSEIEFFSDTGVKYDEVFNSFISKYSKNTHLIMALARNVSASDTCAAALVKELESSRKIVDTLKLLYKDGKFSSFGLNQETLRKLEEELDNKRPKTKSYIVLISKISDAPEIKNYLHSLPGFFPLSGVKILNIREAPNQVIYANLVICNYSAEELKCKIESLDKIGSDRLVCVVPLDTIRAKEYSLHSGTKKAWMESAEQAFNLLKGKCELTDEDLWTIINKSKISTDQLLSILPFNIFIPNLSSEEEEFLIKHYDKLREKFNIKTISDWANCSADELSKYLISLGVPGYSDSISIRNFPKKAKEIGETIVSKCKEFQKAVQ